MIDTFWHVNKEGDILCDYRGKAYNRSIVVNASDFPLDASQVISLMNAAYQLGMVDTKEAIRDVLGVK